MIPSPLPAQTFISILTFRGTHGKWLTLRNKDHLITESDMPKSIWHAAGTSKSNCNDGDVMAIIKHHPTESHQWMCQSLHVQPRWTILLLLWHYLPPCLLDWIYFIVLFLNGVGLCHPWWYSGVISSFVFWDTGNQTRVSHMWGQHPSTLSLGQNSKCWCSLAATFPDLELNHSFNCLHNTGLILANHQARVAPKQNLGGAFCAPFARGKVAGGENWGNTGVRNWDPIPILPPALQF